MLAGAIGIPALAFSLPEGVIERLPSPALSLVIAGAATGHVIYFIYQTTRLGVHVAQTRNLRLYDLNPIDTPGLRTLSRFMQMEATLGLALCAVVSPPLAFCYANADGALKGVFLVALFAPLCCVGLTGILLQSVLGRPARERQEETLRTLAVVNAERLSRKGLKDLTDDDLSDLKLSVEFYSALGSTRQSYLRTDLVAQYAVVFLGAALTPIVAYLTQK
jgi:hypothetical protein